MPVIVDTASQSQNWPDPGAESIAYKAFTNTNKLRSRNIYIGANDGMLHALTDAQDSSGGQERWGYVPQVAAERRHAQHLLHAGWTPLRCRRKHGRGRRLLRERQLHQPGRHGVDHPSHRLAAARRERALRAGHHQSHDAQTPLAGRNPG